MDWLIDKDMYVAILTYCLCSCMYMHIHLHIFIHLYASLLLFLQICLYSCNHLLYFCIYVYGLILSHVGMYVFLFLFLFFIYVQYVSEIYLSSSYLEKHKSCFQCIFRMSLSKIKNTFGYIMINFCEFTLKYFLNRCE